MNNEEIALDATKVLYATYAGYFATICFIIQYAPQLYLNWKRKSCKGFSSLGIIIKLIGASFLCANTIESGEALPVIIYGVFNVSQHLAFMIQFTVYSGSKKYLWLSLICVVPFTVNMIWPESMVITNLFKPASQLLSHLPQLHLTYQKKSSEGVSLTTQHLNMLGGIAGLYMYSIITAKSPMIYVMYINSIFQAVSLYYLAVYFDGWIRIWNSLPFVTKEEKKDIVSLDLPPTTDRDDVKDD